MKKVFSLEKYIEYRLACGDVWLWIELSINVWAKDCEGLTKEEMWEKGLVTMDEWMVEVDDEIL